MRLDDFEVNQKSKVDKEVFKELKKELSKRETFQIDRLSSSDLDERFNDSDI